MTQVMADNYQQQNGEGTGQCRSCAGGGGSVAQETDWQHGHVGVKRSFVGVVRLEGNGQEMVVFVTAGVRNRVRVIGDGDFIITQLDRHRSQLIETKDKS